MDEAVLIGWHATIKKKKVALAIKPKHVFP